MRSAVCAALDRACLRIAPLLATEGMTPLQTRAATNAVVFGYFAALEQWHLDGGTAPIATYVEEGLRPLGRIWTDDEVAAEGP